MTSFASANEGEGAHDRPVRRWGEGVIHAALLVCAAVSVITTTGIVAVLVWESVPFFREVSLWEFFTDTKWTPLFQEKHFGIQPLLIFTMLVSAGAVVVAAPIGLGTAIYLSEYASPAVRSVVKPVLEVLAGIPSVVYGVLAVTTISPLIQWLFRTDSIYSALSASIVVGFMILPMVVSLSEDVLRAVPRSLREAAYALGATKLDVTVRVVTPAALSGIVASILLAISRAIGETMAVTLAGGAIANLTFNPLDPGQTMTAFIVSITQGDTPTGSLAYQAVFAVGLTLFLSTMLMNVLSQQILNRMREQYE